MQSRVLTSDDHVKKIQEKKDEDECRKREIEKRKKEREERKEAKSKKTTSSKKGKQPMQTTSDSPAPVVTVVDLEVCNMCKRVEPESGEDDVQWIECDTCECWYHVVCVGMDETDCGDTYFVCEDCCSV